LALLKILILCYEFPPLGGGGARVVDGLARQLVASGHEVDILTSGRKGLQRQEIVGGATVHRVRTLRVRADRSNPLELLFYCIAAVPTLRRLLANRQYDVCNCHFIFPDGLLSLILGIARRLPVLITAHGSDVPGYNPHRFRFLHLILLPLWKHVVRRAGAIICPSPTLRQLVLERCPQAWTLVIPNGFDPARFDPSGRRENRILVVCRLFRRKGIQHLIEAFATLETEYELHIVGDGPDRSMLEKLARETTNTIRFWGWLDNSDPQLTRLYETSAIFALPSEAENFPVCLLEAMASGLAIITTQNTGCADVVGETAILVDYGDVAGLRIALNRLIDGSRLRGQLGQAGRRRLEEHFTWPSVTQRYVNAFKNKGPEDLPSQEPR
jgi:glycosyltransferase involved in cell wall biosynthesis